MKTPIDYFEQGRCARADGLPLVACPLRFRAWPFEAWCLGWNLAEIEANVGAGDVAPEPLVDNRKTPFQQGQVAYAKGLRIDALPYDPGTVAALQWEAGWIASTPPKPLARLNFKPYLAAATIAAILWAIIDFFVNH